MSDVYGIIRESLMAFNIPADMITPEATLTDLEMDSLALAEFALILEDRLGVKIGDADITKDASIADLVSALTNTYVQVGP
ncbi:acyl carrier protein [Streptomyces sp. NPDC094032]|uniref:acyl carrier protein n=1 Tax=Streptomyces sp. NPDC094032 TaxID=3155308 RepID=UPI00332E0E1D